MLCYRDMTFCNFWRECAAAKGCPRCLTPEVEAKASRWWGNSDGSAPIALFLDKPTCFRAAQETKEGVLMADPREVIKRGIMHCLMGVDSDGIADIVMERLAEHGLTIVSVEPTEAMLEAGRLGEGRSMKLATKGVWQAMLRAAQEPGNDG